MTATTNNSKKLASFEFNRKMLHILFAAFPIGLYYLPQEFVVPITLILAVAAIVFDVVLKKIVLSGKVDNLFYRQSELSSAKKFSGSFWIVISSLVAVIFFHQEQYIPAMLAISFCDSLASIVGQMFGRHRLFGTKKTIEGFVAFICGFAPIWLIVAIIGLQVNIFALFCAIVFAAVCELITFVDDNLSVMLGVCLFLALFAI